METDLLRSLVNISLFFVLTCLLTFFILSSSLPEPEIQSFGHPSYEKEKELTIEECCTIADKIDLLHQELSLEKENFINLRAKFLFLEALQDFDSFEDDDVALLSAKLEEEKNQLRGLKQLNNTAQQDVSSLITNFSESHAHFENDKNHFLKENQTDHFPSSSSSEKAKRKENPEMRNPISETALLTQKLKEIEQFTTVLEKIGGLSIKAFLSDGIHLQIKMDEIEIDVRIGLDFSFDAKGVLTSVEMSPNLVPFDDLLQYTRELGGDVTVFLVELLSRISQREN